MYGEIIVYFGFFPFWMNIECLALNVLIYHSEKKNITCLTVLLTLECKESGHLNNVKKSFLEIFYQFEIWNKEKSLYPTQEFYHHIIDHKKLSILLRQNWAK